MRNKNLILVSTTRLKPSVGAGLRACPIVTAQTGQPRRVAPTAILIALFTATALVAPGIATGAESVESILKKMDAAGFSQSSQMILAQKVVTPGGAERTFKMTSYSQNGSEKALTVYTYPKQAAGMKILTLNDGDDLWTYFPSSNRTRKLASSMRNRKVQGSDFTYDDMATGKMARNWKGKVLGTEKMTGKTCYKLALVPTEHGPKSYSKITAWVDKSNYTSVRIDYYDLDGEYIKRLDIGRYKKVSGVLIPLAYKMTNQMDGGTTMMKVDEKSVKVNLKLDPILFTEAGLSR